MRRVRISVVVAGVALAGVAATGALWGAGLFRPHGFEADWDKNFSYTAPVEFAVVRSDPSLRKLMVERTSAAFKAGGWPAATGVFYQIVDNRINIFASDAAVLACNAAWRDVYRELLPYPKLCRLVIQNGTSGVSVDGAAADAVRREDAACDAITLDGGRHRQDIIPPEHMSQDEQKAVASHALDGPKPLTMAERSAVLATASSDDRSLCHGRLTYEENIVSLGPVMAARYYRSEYNTNQGDFIYEGDETPLGPQVPPDDFRCPASGTKFTLSIESSVDGRPITWEVLGQNGWDCRLRSSATGLRALLNRNDFFKNNPLRELWPLHVGRTAHCHCEYNRISDLRVTGYDSYWLPWGKVDAFAIEEKISDENGSLLFTTTRYWAPSLDFLLGQTTAVARGGWPDDLPPDWQLVAITPPRAQP